MYIINRHNPNISGRVSSFFRGRENTTVRSAVSYAMFVDPIIVSYTNIAVKENYKFLQIKH